MLELAIILTGAAAVSFGLYKLIRGPRCRFVGRCRLAIVGDSIAQGQRFTQRLREGLPNYVIDNFAVQGAGTASVVNQMLDQVVPAGYDEVIILAGANDIAQGPDYIVVNIERIVRAAKLVNMRVVLLSMTPWLQGSSVIRNVNNKLKIYNFMWRVDDFVNVWGVLADSAGGLRGDYIGDAVGLHPNALGQQAMADKVLSDAY